MQSAFETGSMQKSACQSIDALHFDARFKTNLKGVAFFKIKVFEYNLFVAFNIIHV